MFSEDFCCFVTEIERETTSIKYWHFYPEMFSHYACILVIGEAVKFPDCKCKHSEKLTVSIISQSDLIYMTYTLTDMKEANRVGNPFQCLPLTQV